MIVLVAWLSHMLLAPDSPPAAEELELLIREARRRQRRRQLATLLFALAAVGAYVGVTAAGSAPRSGPLLSRPLHFPPLGAGGRCPVSSGYRVQNPYFAGEALGRGPGRVLIANRGDVVHGRPMLGTGGPGGWYALQTLWFAMPGYDGPFVVRAARLGKRGEIAVQSGGSGLTLGPGPLVVPAGATINTYYTNWRPKRVRDPVSRRLVPTLIGYGYRTVPSGTWIKSPGCYAWQIDGRGFSEVIVFDALAPPQVVQQS